MRSAGRENIPPSLERCAARGEFPAQPAVESRGSAPPLRSRRRPIPTFGHVPKPGDLSVVPDGFDRRPAWNRVCVPHSTSKNSCPREKSQGGIHRKSQICCKQFSISRLEQNPRVEFRAAPCDFRAPFGAKRVRGSVWSHLVGIPFASVNERLGK